MEEPKIINLWYLSGNPYGGWASYTSHLARGLSSLGHKVVIRKLVDTERDGVVRDFGYGVKYTSTCKTKDFTDIEGKHVIVALQKNHIWSARILMRELEADIVLHDPAELKSDVVYSVLEYQPKVIVIRTTNLGMIPGAKNVHFVPHPYVPTYCHYEEGHRGWRCISISRVDFDKNTDILLDANRLGSNIKIFGFENRIYTRFNLIPDYPEWEQSKGHFEKGETSAVDLCRRSDFVADMSTISGDGGGTQYTFLEAMDAGSTLILNKGWIRDGGVMTPGTNCLAILDGRQLNGLLDNSDAGFPWGSELDDIRESGFELVRKHDATKMAKEFIDALS